MTRNQYSNADCGNFLLEQEPSSDKSCRAPDEKTHGPIKIGRGPFVIALAYAPLHRTRHFIASLLTSWHPDCSFPKLNRNLPRRTKLYTDPAELLRRREDN